MLRASRVTRFKMELDKIITQDYMTWLPLDWTQTILEVPCSPVLPCGIFSPVTTEADCGLQTKLLNDSLIKSPGCQMLFAFTSGAVCTDYK